MNTVFVVLYMPKGENVIRKSMNYPSRESLDHDFKSKMDDGQYDMMQVLKIVYDFEQKFFVKKIVDTFWRQVEVIEINERAKKKEGVW